MNTDIQHAQTRRIAFDREEQLLLQNQDFKVKDTGVDLQRLIEATAFSKTRFQKIQEGREALDREVAALQLEIQAIDRSLPNPARTQNVNVSRNHRARQCAPGHRR